MAKRKRKPAMKAAQRKAAAEIVREGDWGEHLATLRQALEERKPDALQRIRSEIMTLDDQIARLIRQSDLVPKSAENQQAGFERGEERRHQEALDMLARRRGKMPELVAVKVAKITAEIETKAERVQDLSNLISALRAEPFAQDYGGTPETMTKARDWLVVYETKGFKTGQGQMLKITKAQREAGQMLAMQADRTVVSLKSCLNNEPGSGGVDGPIGMTRREKAVARYTEAVQSMGLIDAAVVIGVSILGMSIPVWAKVHKAPEEPAFKALDRGLKALASHYRLDTQRISA